MDNSRFNLLKESHYNEYMVFLLTTSKENLVLDNIKDFIKKKYPRDKSIEDDKLVKLIEELKKVHSINYKLKWRNDEVVSPTLQDVLLREGIVNTVYYYEYAQELDTSEEGKIKFKEKFKDSKYIGDWYFGHLIKIKNELESCKLPFDAERINNMLDDAEKLIQNVKKELKNIK